MFNPIGGAMRVTQTDIAKKVGVSQFAVSHALRGDGGQVSAETRKRILDAARKMGYRINTAARATRTRQTGNIGFLRSAQTLRRSWYPQSMLDGIEAELEDRGLRCVLGRIHEQDIAAGLPLPPVLREWTVDGLILNWIAEAPAVLSDLLDELRLPTVWTNNRRENDCVFPDDLDTGRRGAELLLERGHRKVVLVNYRNYGLDNPHYAPIDRCQGYREAMTSAGLTPQVIERPSGSREEEWLAVTRTWMGGTDPATAFVAISEAETAAVMQAAGEVGRVPGRDVSVVCLDAAPQLRHMNVTRFAQPWEQIGREAVRMVCQRVEEPGAALPPRAVPADYLAGTTVLSSVKE